MAKRHSAQIKQESIHYVQSHPESTIATIDKSRWKTLRIILNHSKISIGGIQLFPTYLSTKKGNCVSMPLLFFVLGHIHCHV